MQGTGVVPNIDANITIYGNKCTMLLTNKDLNVLFNQQSNLIIIYVLQTRITY